MASPGNISSQRLTKRAITDRKEIAEYAPRLREIIPNFDKLSPRKQSRAATMKYLQEKVFPDNPDYSNKAIRAEAMGLATKDYDTVTRDDLDRPQLAGKIKKKNPAGFRHGGKVCRGRKANYKD